MAYNFHTLTQLGPAYVGLEGTIGYRVISRDGVSILTAFTTAGVLESINLPQGGVPGDYVVPAGISLPDDTPVIIQWGNNTDWYTEEPVTAIPYRLDVPISSRLAPTIAGRTIDLDATGRVNLGQWKGTVPDNLILGEVPAGQVTILAAIVALVEKFTGITLLANWLRAMSRSDAADATALSELNDGGGTYDEATDSLQAGSGGIGAVAEEVWEYHERTLTQSARSVIAAVLGNGGDLSILRGDLYTASLTGLGNLTGRTKLWITFKKSLSDTDDQAIVQIRETTGLIRLNGAAAVTAAQGSLVVDDAFAGDVTITIDEAATALLTIREGNSRLYYDIQMMTAAGIFTKTSGRVEVTADVTRAVT